MKKLIAMMMTVICVLSATGVIFTAGAATPTMIEGENLITVPAGQNLRVRFIASEDTVYTVIVESEELIKYDWCDVLSFTPPVAADKLEDKIVSDHVMKKNHLVYIDFKCTEVKKDAQVKLTILDKMDTPAGMLIGQTCTVHKDGNVREYYGLYYKIIEGVAKGEKLVIKDVKLGNTGKDWYLIETDGVEGWISSTLVKLNGNKNGTIDGVPIP